MDYEALYKTHVANDADVTIAYAKGIPPKMESNTEIILDEDSRVTAAKVLDCYSSDVNYSLKVMIIRRTLLERLLHEAHSTKIDDFETIISNNVKHIRIYGYEVTGFVKVIGSLQSYYDISMDLLKKENRKELFTAERPVYTKVRDEVPATYGIGANVKNSLIADGCRIEGEVENSILFRGVHVEKGAVIKNSVLFHGTHVSKGAQLNAIVTDKDVFVSENVVLSGNNNMPFYVQKNRKV